MENYPKFKLSRERIIPSSLKGYFQTFQWFFYPQEGKYTTKVAIYFALKDNICNDKKNIRSIYFMQPEHIDNFIIEATWAELKLKEKTYTPYISSQEIRIIWLDYLLEKIRENIIERWKEEEIKCPMRH